MALPGEAPSPGKISDASHPSDTGRATDVGGYDPPDPAKPKGKGKGKGGGIKVKDPGPAPTTAKGPPSNPAALKMMSEKYTNFAKWVPNIKLAAKLYGVDSVELYGVLVALGSRGDPNYTDATQGRGLARISWPTVQKWMNPTSYASFVKRWGNQAYGRAYEADFAINYLAWMMGGSRNNYGSLNAWLGQGPEGASKKGPRYGQSPYQIIKPPGTTPTDIIKASGAGDYQPTLPPTIPDKTDKSIDTSKDRQDLTDPFVAGVDGSKPGGGLVLTGDSDKAIMWMGAPVRRSTFLQVAATRAKYFQDYTGKNPTNLQIGNLLRNNWGERDLITLLAKGPNFHKSPIYQRDSLAYQDAGKDLVPKGKRIPDDLMRKAIVNGWSIGAFQQALRNNGYYEQSNEFQNNYGVLQSSYRNIMGEVDSEANKVIKRATKLGWTQPIFESWLRRQDTYKYSPEYQSKVVSFLDSMGMFIGARATLTAQSAEQMANVPTEVMEGGKKMQLAPPLNLMPSGSNPMLKANFPYTSTPTPPTHTGKVHDPYKAPPMKKKPATTPEKKTTTAKKKTVLDPMGVPHKVS